MIYSLMMKASEQMQNSRHPGEYEQISKRYIEVLEQEQKNYNAMVRSLTQEELRLMRLRKAMARDSLTGCRNRATFEIEGARYLSDHAEGCLVFIDLDFLKEVNDKYGHESGDQYLLQFAKMMENALSHNEFLYRYAGDEFIVLSNRSKLKVEMMLDELLRENPIVFMLQEEARHISFSYGVVEFGEMPGDIYTMIREADHRMYQCKTKNHSRLQKKEKTL